MNAKRINNSIKCKTYNIYQKYVTIYNILEIVDIYTMFLIY